MPEPLVSVIVPMYNTERFIKECTQSIQSQDYSNIEIVIVNDASTDRSADIVYKLAAEDKHIRLINNPHNLGECKTSAIGFREAKGAYLCRLSADDAFINPDHLSKQIQEMEIYGLDWCYYSKSLTGPDLKASTDDRSAWINPLQVLSLAMVTWIFDNWILRHPKFCYLIAGKKNPVNSSSIMFRGSIFRAFLQWDSSGLRSICDGSLLTRMLELSLKARAIHRIGSFYRIQPGQATGKPKTNDDLHAWRDYHYRNIYEDSGQPGWFRICAYLLWRTI